jgi:DNA-binding transcriptional MerR regulator
VGGLCPSAGSRAAYPLYCQPVPVNRVDPQVSQAASGNRRPLLKAAEVCEILKVQPYVLRSWEKEFPNLGVAKTADGPRLYRRADLDEVQRIKQLVFGEGLTIAGARRKLEEERATTEELPFEELEEEGAPPPVSKQARARLERVRRGLQSILELLDRNGGGKAVVANGHAAQKPGKAQVARKPPPARPSTGRRKSGRA